MSSEFSDTDRFIAIVGSRTGIHPLSVEAFVNKLDAINTVVVSGGALGVDRWAEAAAANAGIRIRIYKPDYDRYGRAAPLKRNKTIVENSHDVVAFWDGASRGTEHTIKYALEMRRPTCVFGPSGKLVRFYDEDGTIIEPGEQWRTL